MQSAFLLHGIHLFAQLKVICLVLEGWSTSSMQFCGQTHTHTHTHTQRLELYRQGFMFIRIEKNVHAPGSFFGYVIIMDDSV